MTQKRTLAAIMGATAAAATVAFTSLNEGRSNNPYQDSGGVWTVCDGQTGVPMHYYTNAQCDAMLSNTLVQVTEQIRTMTPGYDTLPDGVKESMTDFAYNVGVNAYRNSTFRRMLSPAQLPAACAQLLRYKFVGQMDCSTAKYERVCGGVWTRRLAEYQRCKGE